MHYRVVNDPSEGMVVMVGLGPLEVVEQMEKDRMEVWWKIVGIVYS